jgi:hypothetical protein
MGMVGGLDLHRRQITFDVVELGHGVARQGVAARSRSVPSLASRRSEATRMARARGRGVHGLALCRRRDRVSGVRGASRGTRRYASRGVTRRVHD